MTISAARPRSALEGVALPAGVRDVPFATQLDLRADPANVTVMAALARALGVSLPLEPNTVIEGSEVSALWLGPDEWLIVGPLGPTVALEAKLREALAGARGSVVDVSANRVILELSGPAVREILEHGVSIDLHPRAFGPGRCAQTLLARAGIILWQTAAEPQAVYRILVRPSFAGYVVAWLEDAIAG